MLQTLQGVMGNIIKLIALKKKYRGEIDDFNCGLWYGKFKKCRKCT